VLDSTRPKTPRRRADSGISSGATTCNNRSSNQCRTSDSKKGYPTMKAISKKIANAISNGMQAKFNKERDSVVVEGQSIKYYLYTTWIVERNMMTGETVFNETNHEYANTLTTKSRMKELKYLLSN
jgi:hypothetical protein